MKNLKYCILICCLAVAAVVNAQGISTVSGTVSDEFGPIMGAAVVEVDGSNRNISATVTDMNGNFTLKIKNPKNHLKISYMGLNTITLPINKRVYNLTMEDATKQLGVVEVKAKKRVQTSGLAIPEREVSFASQSIDAKEFEGLGVTSIDEALQGRIAGLDIVANSGNLGSGSSMRLRGVTSISTVTSSEPLIVVNGDVWNVDQSSLDLESANEESFAQLLNVNPEDIQSISVLKDAAATAIWGSQGANGVIEIKTKRGSKGKPRLSYNFRLTGTYQPAGIDLLTGDQYTMMLKEAYFNPKQNDQTANIPELNYNRNFSEFEMFNENTDWVKEVKQVGWQQSHNLAIVGGDEKAQFRISAGYDHQTGSIIKQKLDRFTTRMCLDYYVSDRITVITDFDFTYTDNHKNLDDLLGLAYRKMPNLAIYAQDANGYSLGTYYEMLQADENNALKDQRGLVNPLHSAEVGINRQKTYAVNPKLELKYDLLGVDDEHHRLTYNGKVLVNVFNSYLDTYRPRELSTLVWNGKGVSSGTTDSSKSLAFTTTHTLTFTPHIENEDHYFTTMGRFQMVSGNSNGQNTSVAGLPNNVSAPSAGALNPGMNSSYNRWRSLYYTFSAHYAFRGRYIMDYSMRVDGTTKFGPSSRWGFFPAVSARWNVIDEPWMEKTRKWLSMLSIRPGWGLTGNQPRNDYLYLNTYSAANFYLGSLAMAPNNLKLTNLKWENKYTYNLGFDLGFFEQKLTMDINLYNQTTKDMLMGNVGIASSSGYGSLPYMNVGDMNNKGWEFNIQGHDLFKKDKFSMDVNVTFANNRNVITRMDPVVLESLNNDWKAENAFLLQRVQIDNPFGAIYGFRSKGVYQWSYDTYQRHDEAARNGSAEDQEWLDRFAAEGQSAPIVYNAAGEIVRDYNGDPLQMTFNYKGEASDYYFKGGDASYEDVNHDGTINQLDIVYLGNSLPKLTGGFGFRFRYGAWALNAQFNYRINYDIVNMARLNMENMRTNNNQSQAVNYRWRKEGDVTTIPRALADYGQAANYNTLLSDRFVEDGTFLRLNYLQLSYRMPAKLAKKAHLNGLNFYLSANNLFCLTKYTGVDPEIGYGSYSVTTDNSKTPRAKSFTFGITIDF